MISIKLVPSLVIAVALAGCASHTDARHPIPRYQRHLSITFPGKSPVTFVAPWGWHIIQQPERTQNFTFVLSRTGAQEPSLMVSCDKPMGTADYDEALQVQLLKVVRRHGDSRWSNVGFIQDSSQNLADGRQALVYHWVGNDGEQLIALIPEDGFVTEIALFAQSSEDIVANKRAFVALLTSYRGHGD
jgi:hypothetical protein